MLEKYDRVSSLLVVVVVVGRAESSMYMRNELLFVVTLMNNSANPLWRTGTVDMGLVSTLRMACARITTYTCCILTIFCLAKTFRLEVESPL